MCWTNTHEYMLNWYSRVCVELIFTSMCWTDIHEYVLNWYSRVCVELILTSICWTDIHEYMLNWYSRVCVELIFTSMCWTDIHEYVMNWYSRVCDEQIFTSMWWTDGREYVLNRWSRVCVCYRNSRVLCNISLQLAALGGFILIFGFVAFNGGALGTISNPGDGAKIGLILTNTVVAGSFGAISCMAIEKLFRTRYWSLLMSINGALTGMVSYCSSSCVADRSLYIC